MNALKNIPAVLAGIGAMIIYVAFSSSTRGTITNGQFWLMCVVAFALCAPAIVREERRK